MAPPSPPRAAGRASALALLAGLMIFAGRSALTFYAGSPVPFHVTAAPCDAPDGYRLSATGWVRPRVQARRDRAAQ